MKSPAKKKMTLMVLIRKGKKSKRTMQLAERQRMTETHYLLVNIIEMNSSQFSHSGLTNEGINDEMTEENDSGLKESVMSLLKDN